MPKATDHQAPAHRVLTVAIAAMFLAVAGMFASPLQSDSRRIVPASAGAARRVALVIGNASYPGNALLNPVHDAQDIGSALRSLAFTVVEVENAGLKDLEKAVNQFIGTLKPGDVALVYYSGHGIQIDGENYLVPVDFKASNEVDAKYSAYSAQRLQERVGASGVSLSILVLDACRNNPFRASRGGPGGWAAMQSGKGTFIAFATAPGESASDNPRERNGLFTKHLLRALSKPHLSIVQVFQETTEAVNSESGGKQQPWMAMSVTGGFVFRDPSPESQMPPPDPQVHTTEQVRTDSVLPSVQPDLQEAEERLVVVRSGAEAEERFWDGIRENLPGKSLRSDVAVPLSELKQFVRRADTAVAAKDAAAAVRNLDLAEKQLDTLKRLKPGGH